ncbi:5-carboxymethyl-2-hydroxymuconate isomerase [Rhodoferax ferrireducens]|uniref:5-carboxymethyl-2-hydroxymuconate isomerase n=1 Tax=Rhodoferax ferrireducens TaxID=192843 RepID=A0ABU2C922_9BURK|nr:5-carboxymethyl-2-hydroxymuconate Delta-isomerase [Rhodoferax ferrireducens]MDR7377834.1 5-carboxymethyl-2-hydroxymuconate isomerase [Rhodoferax ferrireducens]
MPHLTIEVSANLELRVAASELLNATHQALLASGVFDGPDVKSRVVQQIAFRIGVGTQPEGFVHASLELLAGRTELVRQQLSQAVVAALVAALPRGIGFPVQVSCDIREMNRDCYSKAIYIE